MYRCEGYNIGPIMPSSTISALNGPTGFVGEAQNKFDQPTTVRAALLALGIVYGDLGTSPLYTLQTIVHIIGDQFTVEAASYRQILVTAWPVRRRRFWADGQAVWR